MLRNIIYLFTQKNFVFFFEIFGFLNSRFNEIAWEKQCLFNDRKQIVTNIVHLNPITI